MRTRVTAVAGDYRIDLGDLPATRREAPPRAAGIFLMLFALFWGGIPTLALLNMLRSGEPHPAMLGMLMFTLIGAALFLFGLWQLFHMKEIMVDLHQVTVRERGLLGARRWSERLDRFQGVLGRSEYHSGGKNSPSYTLYIVELVHALPGRKVMLYRSRSPDAFRQIWEDYARRLALPALQADGTGYLARAPEDLDRPIRELVREGKVKVDFDLRQPVPRGIQVTTVDDVLQLTIPNRLPLAALVVPDVLGMVFLAVGITQGAQALIFAVVGALMLVGSACGVLWMVLTRTRLDVGREALRRYSVFRGAATQQAALATSAIESVTVERKDGTGSWAVHVATETQADWIGSGLPMPVLAWLRNCILKVLAG